MLLSYAALTSAVLLKLQQCCYCYRPIATTTTAAANAQVLEAYDLSAGNLVATGSWLMSDRAGMGFSLRRLQVFSVPGTRSLHLVGVWEPLAR